MATSTQTTVYPHKRTFWQLVERTLEYVFNGNPADARQLEQEIDGTLDEEQLLFYHAEPLDVAAEIAQVTPSPGQVQQYRALAGSMGWS
jgi:hypothetical protein